MATNVLSVLDYVVFGLVLAMSTSVGIYYAWKDRNAKDSKQYLTADGQLGIFPVSMSLIASYISSQQILGLPSETYAHGVVFWSSHFWVLVGILITHFIFLPMFYKANFTSANKYFLRRFNSNALRVMASCIAGTSLMFFMGIVLYGPALAISSVTDFSIWTTVLTVGIICTFYTTIGGLKAVIWTDTIQIFIMVAGLMVVLIKISSDIGMGEIWRIATEEGKLRFSMEFNLFDNVPNFYDSLLYGIIYWCSVMSVTQTSVQRYCSMASLKQAKTILFLNFPGINLTAGLATMCGLALFAKYRENDPISRNEIAKPDQIMPFFVLEHLNYGGIPGLFIACVFSSSLSTLSSGYTSLSAIVWGDFLKPVLHFSGKKELYTTKIIAACFGFISIGIAYLCSNVSSIIEGALFGITFGMAWCFTVGVGTLVMSQKDAIASSQTEDVFPNSSHVFYLEEMYTDVKNASTVLPSGFSKLFYLSPYMMPSLSFFVTFACVILGSIVAGGALYEPPVDPDYVFLPIYRLSNCHLPPRLKDFLFTKLLSKDKNNKRSTILQTEEKPDDGSVLQQLEKTRF